MPGFRAQVVRLREGQLKLRRLLLRYPSPDKLPADEFVVATEAFAAVVEEYPELREKVPNIDQLRLEGLKEANDKVRASTEALRASKQARKEAREKFDAAYIHLRETVAEAKQNAKSDEERRGLEELEALFRRRSF